MWIINVALNRPYTFIVLALLILIIAPVMILRTPTDIFPNIDIPVISVAWTYTGLNPEELEGRLTSPYEKALTALVDNVEHLESTTYNGIVVVKLFLQPNASLDTANSQVTAASQFLLRQLPPGTQPPMIIDLNASSVPILQLGISGEGLAEHQLNDLSLNLLRTQLVTIPGAVVPFPFGGKQRQVMINMNAGLLQSKGLSPQDLLSAVSLQNLVLPSGTAKIGPAEYDIRLNTSPRKVNELGSIPIRQVSGSTVYLRDVANVADGFAPQTNAVRQDGKRGVLVTIVKSGKASTLDVVAGVKKMLPQVATTLPPQFRMQPLYDQSIFVKGAVTGVIREAVIAAALTGLMILLFLGSWRSTLIIAVSIPLSILTSVIMLGLLGETINIMTLGGLALAVGVLVDDATVTIENIERFLEEGRDLRTSILEGAGQIALPALVATLCICIVFLPMFFLGGVARYLFVPLAEAVVFAMLASYILSRTLVPTLAMYLLKQKQHGVVTRNPLVLFQRGFERAFERLRGFYSTILSRLVATRKVFVPVSLAACVAAFALVPFLGQDFFPNTDSGQFILHVRAQSGLRIEETARLCDLVENRIRKTVPADELGTIIDNIGLPYSQLNLQRMVSGTIGAGDADVMVSLKENHRPTADYVRRLRTELRDEFPGTTFSFLPADIVTQILNFGLPAPIDIQIEGADGAGNHKVANRILQQLRQVPGLADLRIQQPEDYPVFDVTVDRTKALQGGYTQRDVAVSLLNTLSGSFQTQPMFFLNYQNGVNYSMVAQTPQYQMQTLQELKAIPITATGMTRPEILADVASITRGNEKAVVSHYNIRRVLDVYGAVQDRDLGAVGRDVQRIVQQNAPSLPRGSFLHVRGQLQTMRTSYIGLLAGLGFAIFLVYLLIVVNFQSWLDPFIIITALPAALAGIVLFLFFTHTTLSVPALMGAIMCMGVATANSILVVSFAKERLAVHKDSIRAALEAGSARFRPVLMTATAMIIGMIPMALGAGDGGEQNAPLGRAVIGGLMLATLATLAFVPAVFAWLHGRGNAPSHKNPEEPAQELAGA
ncbi:efflux RND transporter permease subunit [Paludibaculum fermentans]|uniref:Efflux RND transporter permease subunit n=1 Tax=Paludibaculum fermentans TaxID=1473598 RepID=A0A7S7NXP4_PALFE|nr:efflux RND transporter permease subunit [Paludibaculum fermentans]QOY91708.1 efflux RND transporter permease subunit [Paludibaculum fermentans]